MKKVTAKKLIAMLLIVAMIIPTFGMMYSSAATGDTVEIAFNNIFVFESWATNRLSSTVLADGVPQDSGIVKDIANGSFTLTKDVKACNELYTAFSMNSTNAIANDGYYMMDVDPNTTYTFSYDVTGNIWVFTPYVFFYDEKGLWIPNGLVAYGTPGYGYNEFSFTTPATADTMQLRFTIGDNSAIRNDVDTVSATVKDIAIYKSELKSEYLSSQNIFDLDAWGSNELSGNPSALMGSIGEIDADAASGTIKFKNGNTAAGNYLWTGLDIDADGTNNTCYTIPVQPNTSYTLTYSIGDNNLPGAVHCQPWIVEMDADGKCLTYYVYETPQLIGNKRVFTTQANTASIQVVFSIINGSDGKAAECTLYDVGIYETAVLNSNFETVTGHPHRLTYKEGAGTYGELPVPANIPEGKVFAGWYTGTNGSGEVITPDTEISYKSFTVYPYYQTAVDFLEIKTPPVKTTYTLGEKLNTTGLVLEATVDGSTFAITSGYTCTPTYLNSSGTQAVTVSYGGKTATFNVDVSLFNEKTIPVNDTEVVVKLANNVYTLDYTTPEAFSRYEITYYSDAYVKGTITMADGTYEEFFLEPSTNGSFASYVDDYLTGGTYNNIKSIGFESLNKEFGNFELYSVKTVKVAPPADTMAYYSNGDYKAGINLAWGGVLAYLEDTKANSPVAATYSNGITKVNYSSQLPSGATATSGSVNLINTYDKGRYVQQSYYGTYEEPFVQGNYNGLAWNYNPIQGGNILGEASKVVDYRITDTEIYVKTRPLEWAKWSDEAGQKYNDAQPDPTKDKELIYEDSYNAWAYMESWYVFEDGMIKTYCRYVDYSGYPSATTTQEFPAFYCVEPLNNFVYYSGGEAWGDSNTVQWKSDLDFWGATPEYNQMLIANGQPAVNPNYTCNENWAAFMGGTSDSDFGIGIYSADVTNFVAGSYQAKYKENSSTLVLQDTYLRHADTLDPATEDPTSYIAPINTMELESYKEYTYAYYITTGTQEEIREDFRRASNEDYQEEYNKTKIAVPETVYMQPSFSQDASVSYSKLGQFYVNNILDSSDYYNVKTVADAKDGMSFGVHSADASRYKVSVTNVTNPADDIILGNADGTGNVEGAWISIGTSGNDIKDEVYGLRFATKGLAPNEKATAKWEITIEYKDGTTKTYTAYTVLYAPMHTIGAVAEGRSTATQTNVISSWITGANGVDHSHRAPLGSFHADVHDSGYFKYDPLAYPDMSAISGTIYNMSVNEHADDYIFTTDPSEIKDGGVNESDDYSDTAYVLSTAPHDSDSTRAQSYLGLLAIDKSRYTNTNQIPNLNMGYDVLSLGTAPRNSLEKYSTYYTLGTSESFTATSLSATPSGWTQNSSYSRLADSQSIPYRETVVPSYTVSDAIDGKYIHALNFGSCQAFQSYDYSTAGTSVLIDVTDKSALRDAVLDGYTLPEENYSDDTYSKFEDALEDAATVLGDPSASQDEIDQAQKNIEDAKDELVNIYYALKFDNLFSAYEYSQHLGSMTMNVGSNASIQYNAGTLTVISDNAEKTDIYATEGKTSNFYNIDVNGSTEYVFEYDVTTKAGSQVLLFFYDENGNQVACTTQTIQIGDGNSSTITSSPHLAAYVTTDGHVVLRFTTNADVDRIGIRFGNTNNVVNESTFSNIRLIEAENYYADTQYSKTESVYKEYDTYGTLITPVRPGYTFTGWVYEDGTAATAADLATAHKSIYSTWNANEYTIAYNVNGGTGSPASDVYSIDSLESLATPTRDDYIFRGWEVTATDGNWTVGTVYQPDSLPEGLYGNVSLTAVWEVKPPCLYSDSVVIDYGLPVKISVLVNDKYLVEGSLNAIGTELVDGTELDSVSYGESRFAKEGSSSITLKNGTATIEGEKIIFTPSNLTMSSENTFYYEYKTADGKYYYTTVTVIPAANIYYEESFMTFVNGDGYEWQDIGTPITGKFQAEDRPGNFSFAEYDANNAYGNESAYNDSYTYSLGSAKYAVVDANAFGKEPTAKFTFCGTGFDFFSVTNNDTGAVLVTIYEADTTTVVKNYIVNTYYGYKVDEGVLHPNTESTDAMYQVPVISKRDLPYARYDVVIKPIYSSTFDPNFVKGGDASNNAYGIYVDSVRIFNPAGSGEYLNSDIVGDAYLADGEFAPMYMEIRDTVLSAAEYYKEVIENLDSRYTGSLFIDGNNNNGIDETGIATYKEQGPKNELYLGKNQAIAFNVSAEDAYELASLQLGMKVVSGGETAEVVIMNTNEKSPNKINISGAHEQFYSLNSAIVWNQDKIAEKGVYETVYPIVVVNTSDTVISLTSFKWAHTTYPESADETVLFTVNHSTGKLAGEAVQSLMMANNTPDRITDKDVSVEWSDKSFTEGKEATVKITTPVDVVKVTIGGVEITDCEIDKDGNKVWTYTFVVKQSGETEYVIMFYDGDGIINECVKTETIVVEKAPVVDDNTSTDAPGADKNESIFDIILNFFKRILEIFGGVFA